MSLGMKRVDRLIAHRTGESRSDIKRWMRRGLVTVDGVVVKSSSTRCHPHQEITLNEEAVPSLEPLLVYHKPEGILTTMRDQWGRPCVGDILPFGYHIVGRLDADTSGLLLFSSLGGLTQHLLHPKHGVEREYIAAVDGAPPPDLPARLQAGIPTALGLAQGRVVELGPDWVRVIMTEGKNRIVRRMLNNAGFPVLDLLRVRYGVCSLGELEEGGIRSLTDAETAELSQWPVFNQGEG